MTKSKWFSYYNLPQQGSVRVFAFPYSGAGTSVFYPWSRMFLNSSCDFVGVQLPGRENRLQEPALYKLPLLLDALLPAIKPLLDKPFVFFGHSLGALIAFELCRALQRHHLPLPQHLFVSAFRSPELANPNVELHALPDADIIEKLKDYAGTSEGVFANQELMALLLPLLRSDFSLHETYQYSEEPPLSCPITALSGNDDNQVPPSNMSNWGQHTSAHFQQIHYPGSHFFLHQYYRDIIADLQEATLSVDRSTTENY